MDNAEHGPQDDLTGLERRLALWRPAPAGLDHDRMMFDAGRAAARCEFRARVGLASSAALALVSVGLGVLLAGERARRHDLEVRIALRPAAPAAAPASPVEAPTPPVAARPLAPDSYLALTHQMLSPALDAPTSPPPGAADGSEAPGPEPTLRVRDARRLLRF